MQQAPQPALTALHLSPSDLFSAHTGATAPVASFATNLTVGGGSGGTTTLSFTFGNGGQGKHLAESCRSLSLTQPC